MRYGLSCLALSALALMVALTAQTAQSCEPLPCPEIAFPEDPRSGCWPNPFPVEQPDARLEDDAASFTLRLAQALPWPLILPPTAPQGAVLSPPLPAPSLTPGLPTVPSAPPLDPQIAAPAAAS